MISSWLIVSPANVSDVVASARETLSGNDEVLEPYIGASSEQERETALACLLTSCAASVVRGVVRRRSLRFGQSGILGADVEDDITATVMYRLICRLRRGLTDYPINDFRSYVAATAAHVCDDHFREKSPERLRVTRLIRRSLDASLRFGIWRLGDHDVCGFAEWRERATVPADLDAIAASLPWGVAIGDALLQIFSSAGGPQTLGSVTNALLPYYQRRDDAGLSGEGTIDPEPWSKLYSTQVAAATWREIQELPFDQRVSILLHMRDESEGAALRFFLLTKIASVADLASALGMSRSELAALWPDLPLTDGAIGARLGLTSQQVSNARLAARRRLQRRLRRMGLC